jgi:RNA recognition motif-containing protein
VKTLYLGNLQWQLTEDEIREMFSPLGEVHDVQIIRDREMQRSKGYGFITMDNAEKAMVELNGKELKDRSLRISLARSNQG